jgi:hypothetical protein
MARGRSLTRAYRISPSRGLSRPFRSMASVCSSISSCTSPPIHPYASAADECMVCRAAPHFAGDGNTLHQTTHELLALVASPKTDQELETDLEKAIRVDAVRSPGFGGKLASYSFDDSMNAWQTLRRTGSLQGLPMLGSGQLLSSVTSRYSRLRSCVNLHVSLSASPNNLSEQGGHTLPREQRGSRVTMLLERSLEKDETTKALARCKKRGVSVNHALFALANLAWARLMPSDADRTLPM